MMGDGGGGERGEAARPAPGALPGPLRRAGPAGAGRAALALPRARQAAGVH